MWPGTFSSGQGLKARPSARSGSRYVSRVGLGLPPDGSGQRPKVLFVHPLDLEVLEQLPIGHAQTAAFGNAHPVGFDLRGGVRVVETLREQFLPFLELSDMDELVDHVEVDVPPVPCP